MKQRAQLREVRDSDLPHFFEHQLDPEAIHNAAFTARDPSDRFAFDWHWAIIRDDSTVTSRTIVVDGRVAGHIAAYLRDGKPEVTYWLGREYWGQGLATWALRELLQEVPIRPIYGGAAVDNAASLRVLQKCGFKIYGEETGFANARGAELTELRLVLDGEAKR